MQDVNASAIWDELAEKRKRDLTIVGSLPVLYRTDRFKSMSPAEAVLALLAARSSWEDEKVPMRYLMRLLNRVDDVHLLDLMDSPYAKWPICVAREIIRRIMPNEGDKT